MARAHSDGHREAMVRPVLREVRDSRRVSRVWPRGHARREYPGRDTIDADAEREEFVCQRRGRLSDGGLGEEVGEGEPARGDILRYFIVSSSGVAMQAVVDTPWSNR